MKTIKVADAIGPALDWLVKRALGLVPEVSSEIEAYSTDWALAGPIMVREDIIYRKYHRPDSPSHGTFYAMVHRDYGSMVSWHRDRSSLGPTPLIAAMRCYCCSKLGYEVEVPKGL